MPLDIMLPFWGDPAMMRETVESVLRQTSDDWLLTVVDDAYPDPSVKEYFDGLTDPRVSYVRKDVNEGITANFATCAQIMSMIRARSWIKENSSRNDVATSRSRRKTNEGQ